MFSIVIFFFSEAENGEVWYYTTSQQFEELMSVLDADEMETPLVRELLEMKKEIIRQMDTTERLTNQSKGNRKSYLEVENNNIIKQRKLKEDQKHQEQNAGLKIEDDKIENDTTLDADGEVVNEVTITSEETPHDDIDEHHDALEDDIKRIKNNTTNKIKKKNEESKNLPLYCMIFINKVFM